MYFNDFFRIISYNIGYIIHSELSISQKDNLSLLDKQKERLSYILQIKL